MIWVLGGGIGVMGVLDEELRGCVEGFVPRWGRAFIGRGVELFTGSSSGSSSSNSNGNGSIPNGSPPNSPNALQLSHTHSSPSQSHSQQLPKSTNSLATSLLPFLPLLLFLLQSPSTSPSLSVACQYLPSNLRHTLCHNPLPHLHSSKSSTVDLVFAYYDEPLDKFKDHLNEIRERGFVKSRRNRVVVYNKGYKEERELREKVGLREGDLVVKLDNLGREGATYLRVGPLISLFHFVSMTQRK